MKRRILITFVFLTFGFCAYAHRLNEYLQAATISLTKDSVRLHLHLTAGSDIAPGVLKLIDRNGDGILSAEEQEAYARLIVNELSLTIDNKNGQLKLLGWNFPSVPEIVKGLGDIQLFITAGLPAAQATHQLVLAHHNPQARIVYLVNCLLPANPGIRILDQNRNADQSVYQLDFRVGDAQAATSVNQQLSLTKADDWGVIKTYLVQGIRHILTGYDHLLFLCALVLGAAGLWDLIKIVTAFTIAHSITLTLATYGLAHLPGQLVEPMIAASIIFVAVQNVFWPKQAGGYSRLAIAFFFGLFHGLGFAGGLLALMHAMPVNLTVFAILGFSLGVEAGNQLILLPLYGFLQLLKQTKDKATNSYLLHTFKTYASGAVAFAGMYYFFIDLMACF